MTLTNHQYNPQSVIISKKFWDTLSPAEQKILQDAAAEAAKYQRQQSRAALQASLDDLKKAGMQVTELPAGRSGQAARQDEAGDRQALAPAVGEATVRR